MRVQKETERKTQHLCWRKIRDSSCPRVFSGLKKHQPGMFACPIIRFRNPSAKSEAKVVYTPRASKSTETKWMIQPQSIQALKFHAMPLRLLLQLAQALASLCQQEYQMCTKTQHQYQDVADTLAMARVVGTPTCKEIMN